MTPIPRVPATARRRMAAFVRIVYGAQDESWKMQAACRGHPNPDIFHPPKSVGRPRKDGSEPETPTTRARAAIIAEAKAICRKCPVQVQCGVYSLRFRDRYGIWGAKTPRERGFKEGK